MNYENIANDFLQDEQHFAKLFDHTLLKQDATGSQIQTLCEEALAYRFASVCVNTLWLPKAAGMLRGGDVKACVVVGFPLGAMASACKAAETAWAVEHGADEIDTVLSVGLLKSGELAAAEEDIAAVVRAAAGKTVKVILETCLLTNEEKKTACQMAVHAGASFVKTSTGFSTGGATADDVRLMRETVGLQIGVKASGGIRDYKTAKEMLLSGANRVGASASVAIMKQFAEERAKRS